MGGILGGTGGIMPCPLGFAWRKCISPTWNRACYYNFSHMYYKKGGQIAKKAGHIYKKDVGNKFEKWTKIITSDFNVSRRKRKRLIKH